MPMDATQCVGGNELCTRCEKYLSVEWNLLYLSVQEKDISWTSISATFLCLWSERNRNIQTEKENFVFINR